MSSLIKKIHVLTRVYSDSFYKNANILSELKNVGIGTLSSVSYLTEDPRDFLKAHIVVREKSFPMFPNVNRAKFILRQ